MFVLERLISVIAPYQCLNCGEEGGIICSSCSETATIAVPSRCYKCRAATEGFAVCGRCRKQSSLCSVWVSTTYNGLAKRLVQLYKFERGQAGAKVIANYMAQTLPIGQPILLVPVPTATSRQRIRGYDHSLLLAKEIAKLTRSPYLSVVGRLGQSRQVGASREVRLKQLNSAYYVKRPELVKGKIVILVDDIVTTGGTLEAIGKILKQAGATSANAVVFAQAQ